MRVGSVRAANFFVQSATVMRIAATIPRLLSASDTYRAGIVRIHFAAALRGYRVPLARGGQSVADGLLAWMAGEPNVSAAAKRCALLKGDVDHLGALAFLQGLLLLLRDSAHTGLVLDEVETSMLPTLGAEIEGQFRLINANSGDSDMEAPRP